jgi:hypothetical protein
MNEKKKKNGLGRKPRPVKFGSATKSKNRRLNMNSESFQVSEDNVHSWIETGLRQFKKITDNQDVAISIEKSLEGMYNISISKKEVLH